MVSAAVGEIAADKKNDGLMCSRGVMMRAAAGKTFVEKTGKKCVAGFYAREGGPCGRGWHISAVKGTTGAVNPSQLVVSDAACCLSSVGIVSQ